LHSATDRHEDHPAEQKLNGGGDQQVDASRQPPH
jgi:hypothetical protein